MAKTTGLGDNFYVDGYDLSGDTNSLGRIGGGPALMEMQGIDASSIERFGALKDGSIEWVSYFNPDALHSHVALSSLPLTNRIVTYFRGTAIGNAACGLMAKQVNYDPTRAADGGLTVAVQAQASNAAPLEWGEMLTAGKRTDTTATAGTMFDSGVAGGTDFGLSLYLQVFSVAGTSVTVKVQESSDNGADAYADVTGGTFAAATPAASPQSQHLFTATDLHVERYLKVTTSDTFTSAVFAVLAVRHRTLRDY